MWNKVEQLHRAAYNRNYIICEDEKERGFIIQCILQEANHALKPEEVEIALAYACRKTEHPRRLEEILRITAEVMGKV